MSRTEDGEFEIWQHSDGVFRGDPEWRDLPECSPVETLSIDTDQAELLLRVFEDRVGDVELAGVIPMKRGIIDVCLPDDSFRGGYEVDCGQRDGHVFRYVDTLVTTKREDRNADIFERPQDESIQELNTKNGSVFIFFQSIDKPDVKYRHVQNIDAVVAQMAEE